MRTHNPKTIKIPAPKAFLNAPNKNENKRKKRRKKKQKTTKIKKHSLMLPPKKQKNRKIQQKIKIPTLKQKNIQNQDIPKNTYTQNTNNITYKTPPTKNKTTYNKHQNIPQREYKIIIHRQNNIVSKKTIYLKRARPTGLAHNKNKNKHKKVSHIKKIHHMHKTTPKTNKIKRNTIHIKTSTKNKRNPIHHTYTLYAKKHSPQLLLMLCGDIEPNPGPMPNLLQTHPNTHKNRCKMYFIPSTIKLQPEYQHLAQQFSPSLNPTHPEHQEASIKYPHLSKYIYQNQHHPPRILYALINTIGPTLETCNQILTQPQTLDWTSLLLDKISQLQNPPERHIQTTHPYTSFIQANQKLKTLKH